MTATAVTYKLTLWSLNPIFFFLGGGVTQIEIRFYQIWTAKKQNRVDYCKLNVHSNHRRGEFNLRSVRCDSIIKHGFTMSVSITDVPRFDRPA